VPVPPELEIVTLVPKHIVVTCAEMVGSTGPGFTVTVVGLLVAEQPLELVTVTELFPLVLAVIA
jgi:hypothetical protein